MRKGHIFLDIVIVVAVIGLIIAIFIPALVAIKQKVEHDKQLYNVTEFYEDDITPGTVVYMALNGRKAMVIAMRGDGMYWVNYADKNETIEELLLHPFEITRDPPVIGIND